MTFKRKYEKCVNKFTLPTKTAKQKQEKPSNKKDTNIEMKENLLNKEDKQTSED
jgi:hypothetical protein